jgi:hypothetical protein
MKALGIVVSGESLILVTAEVDQETVITSDQTWSLQAGPRPAAYAHMHERVRSYIDEQKVDLVVVKGSALSTGGTKLAHLESAELRGVVQAAAASARAHVKSVKKAALSKVKGSRKVDEYIADDGFWDGAISGTVRKGSREAAFLVVNEAKQK